MKYAIVIFCFYIPFNLFSQKTDQIVKLNGDTLKVSITKVTEDLIQFNYPGESLVNEIAKNSVEKIIFNTGRVEIVNERANVESGIFITNNAKDVVGLKRIREISAKTSGMGWNTAAQAEAKVYEKIKEEAKKVGANVVLITTFSNSIADPRYNTYQASIRAVAYKK